MGGLIVIYILRALRTYQCPAPDQHHCRVRVTGSYEQASCLAQQWADHSGAYVAIYDSCDWMVHFHRPSLTTAPLAG
jgi:hypothetical protein